MKIVLPLAAVGLIAAIFLIPRERQEGGLTAAQIAALGAGLKLDRPRFTGATEDGEAYEIAAEWAVPDGAVPDRIELEKPVGRIETVDHGLVTMRADRGLLRRADETVALSGDVVIETSDGFRFETAEAEIDVAARTLASPGAVRITGPMGTLEAGSLRGVDARADGSGGAARIWFENRVHMVIIPEQPR